MTRFLITDKQSVSLIFDAIKYGKGGEIFIPKIPSCKIIDLIGYLKEKYNSNNKINLCGIRPGEKLHELMINSAESPRTFEFGRNFVILSEIEKYQKGFHDKTYLKKFKKAQMKEFSSKDNLLEGENLKRYLDKLDL
jgi:FlaA1/EpsC-like NDP-sugar epimerase